MESFFKYLFSLLEQGNMDQGKMEIEYFYSL